MVLKSSQVYSVDKSQWGSLKDAYGAWRGICEYNLDNKGLGRIKVRVPSIHGAAVGGASFTSSEQSEEGKNAGGITTEALPWAWPCVEGSGGVLDAGSYDVPLVGAGVWVMFEQGNPDYPVWIGTWPAIPEEKQEANTIESWNIPNVETSMGKWMQEPGLTTPKETHDQLNNDPQVRVLAKTPKGATIMAIDTDEGETLMIIDRAGQMIEMYSPVTKDKNEGNATQRGLKTARDNDSLDPQEDCKDSKAYIRIIDTSYQTTQSGRVWSGNFIKLSAEKDKELLRLHGAGGQDILIDTSKDDHRIVIKDERDNFIYIDKDSNIKMKSKADHKVTIEGNVEYDVKGNYTLKIGGELIIESPDIVTKSNRTVIHGTEKITINGDRTTLNGVSNLDINSDGPLNMGSKGEMKLDSSAAITESCATHTTKAGAIEHSAGAGSPGSAETPQEPSAPDDPAGDVTIPDETFPVG